MTVSESYSPLIAEIMDVWGGYDDFDSVDYVAFVQEENVREMREAESWDGVERELADQAITALRMLAENSDDPEAAIRDRLQERMNGQQDTIIQTYKGAYANAE